ncbi:MAG: hypothetical protein M3179_11495 [Actinomycetota bacterium]|nr:hypothetical protein [Actinomycetota bacterium]
MTKRRGAGLAALVLAVALLGAACSSDSSDEGAAGGEAGEAQSANLASTETGAATLRAGLTGLLTEHVYLASQATGAALRGDTASFQAYATALNGPTNSNTSDLVAAVGSAYGPEAGQAFDGLWRSNGHIPAFVAYTQAVASGDEGGQQKAVADLTAYAKTVGTTMNQLNTNLPADAVEDSVTMHATTLLAVVDAQKAGNEQQVYSSLREAYAHMGHFAETLASATAAQFPEKFSGDAASPASALRSSMTSLLREHVFLASSATGAALGGRQGEFTAAAAALNGPSDSNSADVVSAVQSVYGSEVGTAFDGLWRSTGHIPAFVAYTQALGAGNASGQQKALSDLTAYAKTFGTTMNQVNSNLPASVVEQEISMHAMTLKAVIDAQKAGDAGQVAANTRAAAGHMNHTADALAQATVAKFPEKFSG